jgi:hypothetical protein
MSLTDRLRANGVSEQRLFMINLALRAADVRERASDDELAVAHEYNTLMDRGEKFAAARLRAKNPRAVSRGREALRGIDHWLDQNDVQRKHHGEKDK